MKQHKPNKIKLNTVQSAIMASYHDTDMEYMLDDLMNLVADKYKTNERHDIISCVINELEKSINNDWIAIVELCCKTENRVLLRGPNALAAMRSDANMVEWNEELAFWQMNSEYNDGNVMRWYDITEAGKQVLWG